MPTPVVSPKASYEYFVEYFTWFVRNYNPLRMYFIPEIPAPSFVIVSVSVNVNIKITSPSHHLTPFKLE